MSTTTASTLSSPLVELREYTLHPQYTQSYIKATTESAPLRQSFTPLCFFSLPETGGGFLNVATHAYYYAGGYPERQSKRKSLAQQEEWKSYLSKCKPFVQSQQSNLFVEAPFVAKFPTVSGMASLVGNNDNTQGTAPTTTLLELRRYQLKLGYDTVPKFFEHYQEGLPSKLSTLHPSSSLVTVLYSEVGPLNQVVEIWRHGEGYNAMEASRQGARQATPWRNAIAEMAELALSFSTTIHIPTSFSPLR